MSHPILVNGKFLRAAPTGVHRVALELVNGLAALQAEGAPKTSGLDLSIWYPADGRANAREVALPAHRVLTPTTSRVWEQVTLPLTHGSRTILNLCNVGPVAAANAITMIHDVQVHSSPQSYSAGFRFWYHLVQPVLAQRNRAILTVSEFSRQSIARVGLCPLDKIHVVHNGVDHILRHAADGRVLARARVGMRPYVLALSNTQKHKNLEVLLRAFADPQMAGLDLVLFGSATAGDFAALGLTVPDNVRFAGRVDDGELRALMEGAVALAFPSTTEGFGLPPLEAMLLGCPAVVAPCGALPEVCGQGSLYAAPHDPAAWRAQLLMLASDAGVRAHWSDMGRKQAARFTWRAASLRLAEVLQAVLAPREQRALPGERLPYGWRRYFWPVAES